MAEKRPINLNLLTMYFPSTAIASILHRITGIVIFLFLPFITWFLGKSLASEAAFIETQQWLSTPIGLFLTWAFLTALTYHLLAGIRHMIMDLGYFEGFSKGCVTAWIVFTLSIIISLATGIWLW